MIAVFFNLPWNPVVLSDGGSWDCRMPGLHWYRTLIGQQMKHNASLVLISQVCLSSAGIYPASYWLGLIVIITNVPKSEVITRKQAAERSLNQRDRKEIPNTEKKTYYTLSEDLLQLWDHCNNFPKLSKIIYDSYDLPYLLVIYC